MFQCFNVSLKQMHALGFLRGFCAGSIIVYPIKFRIIFLSLLPEFIVPRLFEEKRRDMVFGFPSFRPSFRPPIGVCTLCKQLLLQFYSDSFETLQMS